MSLYRLIVQIIDKDVKMDSTNNHIDDETLAAFIDNRLIGKVRDDVMSHLVVCDRCRKVSMDVSKIKQEDSKRTNITKILVQYVAPLVLVASLMLVVVPTLQNDQVSTSKGSVVLTEEQEDYSWLEKAKIWIDETIDKIFGDDDE